MARDGIWLGAKRSLIHPALSPKPGNNKGGLKLGQGNNTGKGKGGGGGGPDGYSGATDPLWSSVRYLTNFENSTASLDTAIVPGGFTGAPNGTPGNTISTTKPRFSSKSYENASLAADRGWQPAGNTWDFDNNDFAAEMWIWFTSNVDSRGIFVLGPNSSNNTRMQLGTDASNKLQFYIGTGLADASGTKIQGTTTVTTGAWHFIQLIRKSGVTQVGLDGTQEGSNYTDNNVYSSDALWIGRTNYLTGGIVGFIDAIRITRGAAGSFGNYRKITLPTTFYPTA